MSDVQTVACGKCGTPTIDTISGLPDFGPIGFGLSDRQVLLETADLLMERNWRGDLAETLRDMAGQAPDNRDARWEFFRANAEFDIYKMTSGRFRTTATIFWDSDERVRADEDSLDAYVAAAIAQEKAQ